MKVTIGAIALAWLVILGSLAPLFAQAPAQQQQPEFVKQGQQLMREGKLQEALAMGHPVIGDRKYHRAESSEPLIARVALHAAYLQFVHPHSGESVSIERKLPPDFQHLVRELSR